MIVSQFLENQGNITTVKAIKNIDNSFRKQIKPNLLLKILQVINAKGKINIMIPVGFVKKIKPIDKPVKAE